MKNLPSNSLRFIPAALGLAFALVASNATAANLYFDSNGTTSGYGTGGSWDGANWATASGGTKTTGNWVDGSFAEFYTAASSTITVNASESMAGLYGTIAGAGVTINDAGSGTGNLNITTTGGTLINGGYVQGFIAKSGGVVINCPITGTGGLEPEYGGSGANISLFGNNTYSGGTYEQSSSTLVYFNQNNSFGSGAIAVGLASGSYCPFLSQGSSAITLANNFANIGTGGGVNFANGNTAPVTSTGNWSLGANNLSVRNNGNSGYAGAILTLSGQITGTGNLTLSGANGGTIIVSGANNTYSGTTTVGVAGATAITLKLGAANAIASSSSLIMAGGTLNPGSFNQAMRSSTLNLSASSTIDYTVGGAELDFANSSGVAWTAGKTLNLVSTTGGNWNLSGDALDVGFDATGLTAGQLGEIEFNGTDLGDAAIDANGFIYDTAQPVPEPSTLVLSLLGGLGVLWTVRRRTA